MIHDKTTYDKIQPYERQYKTRQYTIRQYKAGHVNIRQYKTIADKADQDYINEYAIRQDTTRHGKNILGNIRQDEIKR